MISAKQAIATEPQDAITPPSAHGAGARLQRARELRGLSVVEAAQRLHLSERLLHALEQEDSRALPAAVFVRGHLRNYARLLGLAPDALLAAYPLPDAAAPGCVICAQPLLVESAAWHRSAIWQGVNGFILALVLGLPLVWWYGEIPRWLAEERTAAAQPLDVARGLSGSQMPDQEPPNPSAAQPTNRLDPLITNTLLTPVLLAGYTPPPLQTAPAPTVPAAASDLGLALAATAKAWVEVRDAKGVKLFQGTLKAGAQRTLTAGVLPLTVVFKPATAVQLRYDGQPVTVPAAKQGQRVRVQVGQQP